jgi:hypothetical protein
MFKSCSQPEVPIIILVPQSSMKGLEPLERQSCPSMKADEIIRGLMVRLLAHTSGKKNVVRPQVATHNRNVLMGRVKQHAESTI